MSGCSISVKDVYLNIPVFAPGQQRLLHKPTLSSFVGGNIEGQGGHIQVLALQGVSFDIKEGEHLALVGHNGAGKTTLLKVIAGILPPSRGVVETRGSIGCLFDVGVTVNPDMTGFEAVKFHSLIHGRATDDFRDVAADVDEFTGLGPYLNLPIRIYSDGMRARLIAALATAWRRDILLIDEGIGAGDQDFQDRFVHRVAAFLKSAGLLVIASHNHELLKRHCSRGIVLSHGAVHMSGTLDEALAAYSQLH